VVHGEQMISLSGKRPGRRPPQLGSNVWVSSRPDKQGQASSDERTHEPTDNPALKLRPPPTGSGCRSEALASRLLKRGETPVDLAERLLCRLFGIQPRLRLLKGLHDLATGKRHALPTSSATDERAVGRDDRRLVLRGRRNLCDHERASVERGLANLDV
jgi:hypothetical protein